MSRLGQRNASAEGSLFSAPSVGLVGHYCHLVADKPAASTVVGHYGSEVADKPAKSTVVGHYRPEVGGQTLPQRDSNVRATRKP